jgi:hypothetical protein
MVFDVEGCDSKESARKSGKNEQYLSSMALVVADVLYYMRKLTEGGKKKILFAVKDVDEIEDDGSGETRSVIIGDLRKNID